MILRLWTWYQDCLSAHPVKTQVISSGLLWGVGDIVAQSISNHSVAQKNLRVSVEHEEFKVNWKRVAITSMFGVGFVGPVGHFWYEGLDRFISLRLQFHPESLQFVAAKVAMDTLIFGPINLLMFFTYMGFSTGKSASQVKEVLKRDYLPALILEGSVWPFAQVANFRFVPVRYQLLYVNIFCLLDSVFLSWMEQQKDAVWKKQWLASFMALKKHEGRAS